MAIEADRRSPGGAAAFDAIAGRFDELYSPITNPLIEIIRARVYEAVRRHFSAGATLLEVGCGTGEDTAALAARGYRVVAADPAPRMVAAASAKLAAAGRSDAVRFLDAGVDGLARRWPSLGLEVDGVFSNFAPLNCALSLAPLRALLEEALPRGGRFLGVVLPRLCPLEVALFLARGDPRTALRRFRRAAVADVEGRRFAMRYYGARDFDRALGAGFRRVETRSLGLCLPPLSFGPAFARVPGLLTGLAALEDLVSAWPGLRRMGDHVLLAYERA
jgi:SAM-dependent methyltransferase